MNDPADLATLWHSACVGTVFGRHGYGDELRVTMMRALVASDPAMRADEILRWVKARGSSEAGMQVYEKFFASLPPNTAAKTIVGKLWLPREK